MRTLSLGLSLSLCLCWGLCLLTAVLYASLAQAQYGDDDLIGNGAVYGGPKGMMPHALTQPMILGMGDRASLGLDGSFGVGGDHSRDPDGTTHTGIRAEANLGATLTATGDLGWTFGTRLESAAAAAYRLNAEGDRFQFENPLERPKAHLFLDTPMMEIDVGWFNPTIIETSARRVQQGIIARDEIAFSSKVGDRFALSLSTNQGPWSLTAAADVDDRQYVALQWKRPARMVTPAVGWELHRDGSFDLRANPLAAPSDATAATEGQLYAGRFGAGMEYGRLTLGASVGLEAFYDDSQLYDLHSLYDIGLSNKAGRLTYGVSAQHRQSHAAAGQHSSLAADMTIALTRGLDLELGYKITRAQDRNALAPVYALQALADMRLSF